MTLPVAGQGWKRRPQLRNASGRKDVRRVRNNWCIRKNGRVRKDWCIRKTGRVRKNWCIRKNRRVHGRTGVSGRTGVTGRRNSMSRRDDVPVSKGARRDGWNEQPTEHKTRDAPRHGPSAHMLRRRVTAPPPRVIFWSWRFHVSTAVKIHTVIFWVITSCSAVGGLRFGATYSLDLQGRDLLSANT
jgi:hypothetical protein